MSHLVASAAPLTGGHVVKRYAGFGILGADIPATGDNDGSPVLNDQPNPGDEYHWRLETPPTAGTLTIYPDLSYLYQSAQDGSFPWVYRLFENGIDQGTATVQQQVGTSPVLLAVADVQQANQITAVALGQTHRIGIANSQQVNRCSSIRVSDGSVQAPILTSHPHYIIKAPARRFIISK